jgi:hypothetical protein
MNPHERAFTPVAAPPAAGWRRRRWIAAIVAGVLVVGAAGVAALWYFRVCRDCAPILCDDPCSLPTFSMKQTKDLA